VCVACLTQHLDMPVPLQVLSGELVGQALVPYYRQLLPVLNQFRTK